MGETAKEGEAKKQKTPGDENIQVVVRCRPLSQKESDACCQNVIAIEGNRVLLQGSDREAPKNYVFDKVFGPEMKQLDIYQMAARPIVENVLEGYNGTIFAYGQTGTGKTFTMEGTPQQKGIIPNTFSHIFTHIAKAQEHQSFLVRTSYLEIYNEEIRDLLVKGAEGRLDIRERPDLGVFVQGLSSFIVHSPRELRKIMATGARRRSSGVTAMNARSSRSHAIFALTVECCEPGEDGVGHVRVGKLRLVDLAGSERQAKTEASGPRLREAAKINLSLSTLGNVISALVDGRSSHVPYRNSKLTRLLQDSLGGNAKTLMVANLGPADFNYEESLSTLRFACRAKNIRNNARINEDPKDAVLRQLQIEIEELRKKLEEGNETSSGSDTEEDIGLDRKARVESALKKSGVYKKRYTAEQINTFRAKIDLDRKALMDQKGMAEEEKRHLEGQLRKRETELTRAQREHKDLLKKLKGMEKKIIIGGENLLKKAEMQEKLLKESARELEANKQMEMELKEKLKLKETERIDMEERFSSLQDEISERDKKLKKVMSLLWGGRAELGEAREEHERELAGQREAVRLLGRELGQANFLIDRLVPTGCQATLESCISWDEGAGDWSIRAIAYAGGNVREQPSPPAPPSRPLRVDGSYLYFAYSPEGAEAALRQKLGLTRAMRGTRGGRKRKGPPRVTEVDSILRQYPELRPSRPEPCSCQREFPWRPFHPRFVSQCPHLGPCLREYLQLFYYYSLLKNREHPEDSAPFYPRTFFLSRPPLRPVGFY